jgi:hypothetical protein
LAVAAQGLEASKAFDENGCGTSSSLIIIAVMRYSTKIGSVNIQVDQGQRRATKLS